MTTGWCASRTNPILQIQRGQFKNQLGLWLIPPSVEEPLSHTRQRCVALHHHPLGGYVWAHGDLGPRALPPVDLSLRLSRKENRAQLYIVVVLHLPVVGPGIPSNCLSAWLSLIEGFCVPAAHDHMFALVGRPLPGDNTASRRHMIKQLWLSLKMMEE